MYVTHVQNDCGRLNLSHALDYPYLPAAHKLDIGLFANLGAALLSSLQKLMFLPMAEHAARIGGAVAMHPDFDRWLVYI